MSYSSRRTSRKPRGFSLEGGSPGTVLRFLLPALIFVFAVLLFPAGYSLYASFFNWPLNDASAREFIALGNYARLFTDPEFWNSLKLQAGFIVIALPIELALGFAAALLLNREFPGAGVVRTLLLLPVFMLPVLSGFTWRYMLQPDYGPINWIVAALGGKQVLWLNDPTLAYVAVIVQDVWRMWPFMFMLLYAGLTTIPEELFEAAFMDGASWGQRLRRIILPMLRPTIITALLLRLIDALRIFSEVYTMTEGGPGSSTLLFSLYTHRQAFSFFRVGLASAMSIFLLVLSVAVAMLIVRKNMRLEEMSKGADA